MPRTNQPTNAQEFVEYLFEDIGGEKKYVRLVLAEQGQFDGYNGWGKQVILDSLTRMLVRERQSHVGDTLYFLNGLTNEARAALFARFCVHCGDIDPTCQCWNDE